MIIGMDYMESNLRFHVLIAKFGLVSTKNEFWPKNSLTVVCLIGLWVLVVY